MPEKPTKSEFPDIPPGNLSASEWCYLQLVDTSELLELALGRVDQLKDVLFKTMTYDQNNLF